MPNCHQFFWLFFRVWSFLHQYTFSLHSTFESASVRITADNDYFNYFQQYLVTLDSEFNLFKPYWIWVISIAFTYDFANCLKEKICQSTKANISLSLTANKQSCAWFCTHVQIHTWRDSFYLPWILWAVQVTLSRSGSDSWFWLMLLLLLHNK